MKKRVFVFNLIILIVAFIGCSNDGQGPKELGLRVIECLQVKAIDDYLDLCVTIADKKFLIAFSSLTLNEKTAQIALIPTSRRDIYEINDIRKANFNDIASLSGWKNAVVKKISLKKRVNDNGIIFYEGVIVKFKQSALPDLKIGRIVKVKGGWKIMDYKALGFMSMI